MLYIISTKKSQFLYGKNNDKILFYQEEEIEYSSNKKEHVFGKTTFTSKKWFPASIKADFPNWLKAVGLPTIEEMSAKAAASPIPVVLATMPHGFRLARQITARCWVTREGSWDPYLVRNKQQWLCVNKSTQSCEVRDCPRNENGWANQKAYSRTILLEPVDADSPQIWVPEQDRHLDAKLSVQQKQILFDMESDVEQDSLQNLISSIIMK